MKVLFVLHTFPPESWGGTELHVQDIAKVLAAGHELRVFCRAGDSNRAQGEVWEEELNGLPVVRFNNLYADYVGFESTYLHEASHEAFVAELEVFQPDVVHIHHLTGLSTTIVEAAKERGYPVVFSLHDFWTVCPRGQRLHPEQGICEIIDRDRCQNCLNHLWPGWLEERAEGAGHEAKLDLWDAHMRRIFRLCDLILTPSRFHRERMIEDGHISPHRIRALGHGLNHGLIPPRSAPAGRVRQIGYVGSVIPTKGVHVLIEAMKLLAEPEIKLGIWGHAPNWHEKTDYAANLRAAAGEKVRFFGAYDHEELPGILAQIDILVVPSLWWETFSLTIREAILAGIPVVASDLGAMREALQDTEAGLLFPVGDPAALAQALQRLIHDPGLRSRLADHRQSVKTIEANAADYLCIYNEAITIAEQRRNLIEVKSSSFPEKQPAATKSGGESAKDIRVSIEKIGRGDVRVSSAVERGEQTRVSFVFDYGPDQESAEIRLTVDFGAAAAAAPAPQAAKGKPAERAPIPREAQDSSAHLVASMTPEAEAKAREEALYKLDQDIFPTQVRKLDEMVQKTHLDEGEQVPRRPRSTERERDERPRDRQRDDRPRGRDRDDRGPSRDRDERNRGDHRDRNQGDRDGRDRPPRRDRDDRSGRSDQRGPRDQGDNRRPNEGRRDDRRPDDRGPARSRPDAPREQAPAQARSEPKPKPVEVKKADPKADGSVVWNEEANWQLPESSQAPAREKPKRAPNHRTGAQPNVSGGQSDGGGFGSGV